MHQSTHMMHIPTPPAFVLPACSAAKPHLSLSSHAMIQVRFDLTLDQSLKPWLLEVNASPNLRAPAVAAAHGGAPFSGLVESVATWAMHTIRNTRRSRSQPSSSSSSSRSPEPPSPQWRMLDVAATTAMPDALTGVRPSRFTLRALAEHAVIDCVVTSWCVGTTATPSMYIVLGKQPYMLPYDM
jgi:hypothetical protein